MEHHTSSSRDEGRNSDKEFTKDGREHRPPAEALTAGALYDLLAATDLAMLLLDRHLRLLHFTPRAGDLFHIQHADTGRPLADLPHKLDYNRLLEDARQVLDTPVPIEREIASEDGRWYLTRVHPYRTTEDRVEGVVIIFVDVSNRKRAERDLAERIQQVQALASTLTMAEQEERRRIAQILHDDLQQRLFGVQLKLNLLYQDAEEDDRDALRTDLQEAEAWLQSSINVTRKLTVDLSPPILNDEGLTDAVGWLVTQLESLHGLKVDLQADHAFIIEDEDMRVLLFQIVRELLFNVIQHAGVQQATVELREVNDHLVICVIDEGHGFDVDTASARAGRDDGLGLFSIRERLRLFGGRMEIISRPGDGTRVTIHAPAV